MYFNTVFDLTFSKSFTVSKPFLQIPTNNKNMRKETNAPIVIIAGTLCCLFYGFYAIGFSISGTLFTILSIALLFLIVFWVLFFKKRANVLMRNGVYIAIGCVFALFAYRFLLVLEAPPATLAQLSKVTMIEAELSGDPLPAGQRYYRMPVKLLRCSYADGSSFFARGSCMLFIPAAAVKEQYAGGISLLRGEVFSEYYAKGLRLFVKGGFTDDEKAFFAKPVQPKFSAWNSKHEKVRARLRFYLMYLLYEWGEAGGLLLALLAADKTFLTPDFAESFKNAGLAHVLALSGMHVSIVSLAAIRFGNIFGRKRIAIRVSLLSVLFFVWFAGTSPSLSRALGMMLFMVLGKRFGFQPKIFSILSAMITVHIVFFPQDALELGFMLSYGALAGILLFGEALITIVKKQIPAAIAGAFAASIGAQAFTAPIVIGFIGKIAFIGVLASCVISPIVSVFLIFGIAAIGICLLLPIASPIFSFVLNGMYHCIFFLARSFAQFPLLEAETISETVFYAIIPFAAGVSCMYIAKKITIKRNSYELT
ncbi:competence protein ComEC [Treponema phagedenis]|nr:competence protein ComEC [Treponema phagedenis]